MKKRKFNFSGVVAFIAALLVLVIAVPINIIANYFDKNFDMTPGGMYSLSDTTTQLVEENKDKQIEIYFMYDMEELRDTSELLPLYHTLMQLSEYDNISLSSTLPDESPDLINKLDPNGTIGISDGDIVVKCGDTIKRILAGSVFQYENNRISSYSGEELIAGAIRIVTNGKLPVIYFLTGHGEKTINDNYATFAEILKSTNNYVAEELDLSKADKVPDDTAIVFLAGPQTDITDDEKEKLMEFAADGGAIAFFMAPVDSDVIFTNIEDILEQYEIEMQYNVVEESNPEYILNNNEGESDPRILRVDYPQVTEEYTVDLTTAINSLISSEGLVGGISNSRTFTFFDADSEFIEKTSIIDNMSTINSITGEYSYTAQSVPFGGNKDTAEKAESLSGQLLSMGCYSFNKQTGSKIIAIGTTDVLDSEAITLSCAVSQQLVQNSLIWLFNSDYEMNIGSKISSYDYMSFDNADHAENVMKIFTIVPFCLAAVGVIVWLKRRHS